ncbi:MAG: hypothetical protein D6689_15840 [Deltaproteobacteria bacterium]|nr:MAG: hypothetical protein D6689_15840 [Deltaproteobacteria bacterium]
MTRRASRPRARGACASVAAGLACAALAALVACGSRRPAAAACGADSDCGPGQRCRDGVCRPRADVPPAPPPTPAAVKREVDQAQQQHLRQVDRALDVGEPGTGGR